MTDVRRRLCDELQESSPLTDRRINDPGCPTSTSLKPQSPYVNHIIRCVNVLTGFSVLILNIDVKNVFSILVTFLRF